MIDLKKFPHIPLGLYPTPLHALNNAGSMLGGKKRLYIKRDDLCGVVLGGNKVRKLEFILADALLEGADSIIAGGSAQSNHAAIIAACCNRLGLCPHLLLQEQGVTEQKGNLLINRIQGANIRFVPADSSAELDAEMEMERERLIRAGKKPYLIPLGASSPLGALGYVSGMRELFLQAREHGLTFQHIVCATGSGGMHAGIALGAHLYSPQTKVTGISVMEPPVSSETIFQLIRKTALLLRTRISFPPENIHLKHYAGPGYASASPLGTYAMERMARAEGILLDPIYTAKAFGGLIDLNDQGYFAPGSNVLFLHSGGLPTIFAVPVY